MEGLALPDVRTYYKAVVIKIVVGLLQGHIDLWNRIESPAIDPDTDSSLMTTVVLQNRRGIFST